MKMNLNNNKTPLNSVYKLGQEFSKLNKSYKTFLSTKIKRKDYEAN